MAPWIVWMGSGTAQEADLPGIRPEVAFTWMGRMEMEGVFVCFWCVCEHISLYSSSWI